MDSLKRLFTTAITCFAIVSVALSQTNQAGKKPDAQDQSIQLKSQLLEIHAVVTDKQGHTIKNLKKEDFVLSDNRKPQTISTFGIENPNSHTVPVVSVSDSAPAEPADKSAPPAPVLPQRFISLLFDDLNLTLQDALTVRVAALKILDSLAATDRVAIFTTKPVVTEPNVVVLPFAD